MSKYNVRGQTDLKADSHEFWQLVQNRVAEKRSWAEIAAEIGCSVDDLIHWANWVYQPPKKPTVRKDYTPVTNIDSEDLPMLSPSAKTKQFLAWKKARDGARAARESLEKAS